MFERNTMFSPNTRQLIHGEIFVYITTLIFKEVCDKVVSKLLFLNDCSVYQVCQSECGLWKIMIEKRHPDKRHQLSKLLLRI